MEPDQIWGYLQVHMSVGNLYFQNDSQIAHWEMHIMYVQYTSGVGKILISLFLRLGDTFSFLISFVPF